MTLEPLLGSTALYRADDSWYTPSELSVVRKEHSMTCIESNKEEDGAESSDVLGLAGAEQRP